MHHPAPVLLAVGDVAVTVLPGDGCRVGSLRLGDVELLRTAPEPATEKAEKAEQGKHGEQAEAWEAFGHGSFPMAPYAGRVDRGLFNNGPIRHHLPLDLPPHAAHGTVVRRAWRAVGPVVTGADGTEFSGREIPEGTVSAAFVCDLTDPWPYPGRVSQLFELTQDQLRITLSVEALRDSFPAQAGWHPWFRKQLRADGPSAVLDFSPAWQEERGADHLPTGRRIDPLPGPWDDCFALPDGVRASLRWGDELTLAVESDCTWLVVFDEQDDAVAVEPQSGPPNGLNTAPHLVTPIEPLEVTTTWSWQRG
ncbi:aldose epimerase family protein [Streptacidiphilus fuscans]|uniref:Aldose 1-epimerase n=1 Tax=Streptacidiphilus fuscans TaxID=2789292 RepID=A0A931B123_9ACTN|nr:aldose 1-epimerase [Streptacidiphilus fuscans]MBF9068351.1 aldose 1-epimerase [Streptacidiphilus fuscans]